MVAKTRQRLYPPPANTPPATPPQETEPEAVEDPLCEPAAETEPDPQLDEWIDKVKALPDTRRAKVQAIRDALLNGQYDLDGRIDKLFDKFPGELGRLND